MRGLTFSEALDWLKKGEPVARDGWNGKGMWLILVDLWENQHNDAIDRLEKAPFIAMKTADNKVVPWLASQTDILADDWWRIQLETDY